MLHHLGTGFPHAMQSVSPDLCQTQSGNRVTNQVGTSLLVSSPTQAPSLLAGRVQLSGSDHSLALGTNAVLG